MISRVATLFTVLFLVLFAAASATPRTNYNNPPSTDQCNTGTIQCCDSTAQAGDEAVGDLTGLLNIVLGSTEGLVGLTCNPITLIGGGGNSCNSQTVCCTGNNFNGLLVTGCTPININI